MGAFYDSIHVRTEDRASVEKAVNTVSIIKKCNFLLSPEMDGWISIFPKQSGGEEWISNVNAKNIPCEMFHLIVHDDDVFYYFCYRDGRLIDEYNSYPEDFDEDASKKNTSKS